MVFLVDDDMDDLEIVQDVLEKNNYEGEIVLAANGQVLMNLLTQSPQKKPELILLDLNMPLKNGFQVLEEIRSHPELKSIPVFILTASSNKNDELRCFQLGCNLFWKKPNTIDEYNTLIRLMINFLKSSSGSS